MTAIARVTVRRARQGLMLDIAQCPYCGQRHTHGAGGRSAPDADGTWGERFSHCGPHSHQRTATGKRRSAWTRGAICRVEHPPYLLAEAEDGSDGE